MTSDLPTCPIGDDPSCCAPLHGVFDVLARKYAMQVVCIVSAHEGVRFGDVESHLPGASTSTLSTRLEDLQEAGLVEREQYDEIPPRVEYRLTETGAELGDRLQPVVDWAREQRALQQ